MILSVMTAQRFPGHETASHVGLVRTANSLKPAARRRVSDSSTPSSISNSAGCLGVVGRPSRKTTLLITLSRSRKIVLRGMIMGTTRPSWHRIG